MKTATKNLEDDHIYVIKLTDVMKAITRSENVNIDDIGNIVDIIRNFADGLHHAKEENLFFPAIGKKGFSPEQGPVAVMLSEHTQGRNFVKGIVDNLELFKNGDNASLSGIYKNMTGYADLLASHISKENNILFRMADKVLSDTEQANLLVQFEKIEEDRPAGSRVNDYIDRINVLASVYKV